MHVHTIKITGKNEKGKSYITNVLLQHISQYLFNMHHEINIAVFIAIIVFCLIVINPFSLTALDNARWIRQFLRILCINQSVKVQLNSAICRPESEAHKAGLLYIVSYIVS